MKKFIFPLGLITANLMMGGSIFKVLYYPGANIMLMLGGIVFAFLFLPAALLTNYQETKRYLLLHWITYIVFSSGVLTIVFKTLHWAGSDLLLQCSLPLPFAFFLPVYLYQTRNAKEMKDQEYLGILFGLAFIAVFSTFLTLH